MGLWQELPEWAQELEEHLKEGETALFILHGRIFDDIPVNGDSAPFRQFLGHWLAQERHVVFYISAWGSSSGTPRGRMPFASFAAWEAASRENPLFPLEVDWEPTGRDLPGLWSECLKLHGETDQSLHFAAELADILHRLPVGY